MKVLVSLLSPAPNRLTGITSYLWSLMEALLGFGEHDYVLATDWDFDALPTWRESGRLQVVNRKTPRNAGLAALADTFAAQSLAARLGADVIFSPHPFAPMAGRTPVVPVLHDLYLVTHPQLYARKTILQWRLLMPHVLRNASRVVAVSKATADIAAASYPSVLTKLQVVHEASRIRTEAVGTAPSAQGLFGLVVANLAPSKNFQLILDALEMVRPEERPPIYWVGRDDMGFLATQKIRLERLGVRQVGSVSDEALIGWYRAAGFYLNTSLTEGFCLPILEAQTLGAPVLCADLPVLREVAGDAALFFDPTEPSQLARRFEQICADGDLRSRLSDAGRRNAERFSWRQAAREMEQVFLSAAQRAR